MKSGTSGKSFSKIPLDIQGLSEELDQEVGVT